MMQLLYENRIELPQKKIELPNDPITPLLGIYPNEFKMRLKHIFICTLMFIAAVFTTAKGGNNPCLHGHIND